MIYYTSDLHFGHQNVIRFDDRPFESCEEMDKAIIDNWNHKVTDKDDIYILGDISMRVKPDEIENYLKQLTGRLHLIKGNHDIWVNKKKYSHLEKYFVDIDRLTMIRDNGKRVVLCHFPIAEWAHKQNGAYHVYGHIHSRQYETSSYMKTLYPYALNAGCMINNYEPVTFDELLENNKIFYGIE